MNPASDGATDPGGGNASTTADGGPFRHQTRGGKAPRGKRRGRGGALVSGDDSRRHSLPDLGAAAATAGTSGSSTATTTSGAETGAKNKSARNVGESEAGYVPDDEWQRRWTLKLCQRCGA